jgi:hypothetical protein
MPLYFVVLKIDGKSKQLQEMSYLLLTDHRNVKFLSYTYGKHTFNFCLANFHI